MTTAATASATDASAPESNATVARAVQSRAQHLAALWADPAARVYAVVMADRIPGVAAVLPPQVAEADCLLPGLLAPEVARRAPYLLRLDPRAPFTAWLLFDAHAEFGEWGALVLATLDFVPLRNRLRGHGRARLPDGSEIPLAWMDPAVMRRLLPLCDGQQLAALIGDGVSALVVAAPRALTVYRASLGRLSATTAGVAA